MPELEVLDPVVDLPDWGSLLAERPVEQFVLNVVLIQDNECLGAEVEFCHLARLDLHNIESTRGENPVDRFLHCSRVEVRALKRSQRYQRPELTGPFPVIPHARWRRNRMDLYALRT